MNGMFGNMGGGGGGGQPPINKQMLMQLLQQNPQLAQALAQRMGQGRGGPPPGGPGGPPQGGAGMPPQGGMRPAQPPTQPDAAPSPDFTPFNVRTAQPRPPRGMMGPNPMMQGGQRPMGPPTGMPQGPGQGPQTPFQGQQFTPEQIQMLMQLMGGRGMMG